MIFSVGGVDVHRRYPRIHRCPGRNRNGPRVGPLSVRSALMGVGFTTSEAENVINCRMDAASVTLREAAVVDEVRGPAQMGTGLYEVSMKPIRAQWPRKYQ